MLHARLSRCDVVRAAINACSTLTSPPVPGPIYVGFGVSSVVHGLFIGQSMRVWRHVELSKRYRAFLILISVLLFAYGAVIVEENCWWGGKSWFDFGAEAALHMNSPLITPFGAQ